MRFSLHSIVFGMSLCLAAPAIAFDPTGDAAVDALFERFEADALVTVTYASASTTTGTTTLTTVAFDPTGDAPTLTMATLEFSGGLVSADGLPTFESMALTDASVATDEDRMTIGSMSAVDVRFRADGLPIFESMALTDASVATDEGRMTIGSMSAVNVRFRADGLPTFESLALADASMAGDKGRMTIGSMSAAGVRFRADGLPTFESLALADASMATDEGRMTIGSMLAAGVRFRTVPADENVKLSALAPPFDRFEMSDLTLDVDGPNPLTLSVARISATANEYVDGIPMSSSVSLTGTLTVPVLVDDPLAEAILALMNLEDLSFDLNFGASINGDTNTITLSPFKATMEDMGAVSLDLVLGGIGMDSFKAAQDAMTDARLQALGMRAMSGSLVSASVRIDVTPMGRIVAFMTSKILEQEAARMGTQPSDFITQAELLLGELGDPELQDRIADAVTTFLEAPGNLTVSASPTEPLPLEVIVAGSRNIPQLVQMLNLDIVANQ